jgi:predicted butyrate kinase (DUF1464 family)
MVRVAGTDPGTSSLDLLVLQDGAVADQCRFTPEQLRDDPAAPVRWLGQRGPFDLIAGPSGYGLPLVRAADCGERELALMNLVRPDERGQGGGVAKFNSVVRAFCNSGMPVIFLPGVIHLPTVPGHRKINRIDLGTADKLCVAALALAFEAEDVALTEAAFCLVELGSAFAACLVVREGRIIDAAGGTSGPRGWGGAGAWDGEFAYLLGSFQKRDVFTGGVAADADRAEALAGFREGLVKCVAGLRAATPFHRLLLSGRLLETEPAVGDSVAADLARFGAVERLPSLPGAWVKHAAQGAALLADGLAGGARAALVESLQLRGAAGTVLDWLRHPRADEVRAAFASRP